MEKTYIESDFCGGESRSYIKMDGTMEDYEKLFEDVAALPDSGSKRRKRKLTNEQEWILYTMWPVKRQEDIARTFKMSLHVLKAAYAELVRQGGPKGEKPAWMNHNGG